MSTAAKKLKEKRKKRNKFKKFAERTRCRWTDPKSGECDPEGLLDYKNVDLIQRLVTSQGKMFSRKRSSSSAQAQQRIKTAIKKARLMGLLPFVG